MKQGDDCPDCKDGTLFLIPDLSPNQWYLICKNCHSTYIEEDE